MYHHLLGSVEEINLPIIILFAESSQENTMYGGEWRIYRCYESIHALHQLFERVPSERQGRYQY